MGGFPKNKVPGKDEMRPAMRNPYPRSSQRAVLQYAQDKMGVMDLGAPMETNIGHSLAGAQAVSQGPVNGSTTTAPSRADFTPGWVAMPANKKMVTQVEMQPGIERVR